MLKVSRLPSGEPEIFTSIQGEGVTLGTPSVFLRLATCNLQCSWCDTRYTWDWERYDVHTQVMTMATDELACRVTSAGVKNVVITGGEPLLQARELAPLATRLEQAGLRIEVETNGTIRPPDDLSPSIDQWNVSPKLASSGNPLQRRHAAEALEWFARCPAASFKFVVVDPADLDEVRGLVQALAIEPNRVLLMPEGTDATALGERASWLVGACVDHGFHFSPRLHILLWGDQRGR